MSKTKYLLPLILILFLTFTLIGYCDWSTNYGYRKEITIDGSTAGVQTNYQMRLVVYKGDGSDSVGNVYLHNHCQNNFNDIGFTKSDGTSELDHWKESYTSGTSAVFWIKFDSIPASPASTNFYIYYDKANPDLTFGIFSDLHAGSCDFSSYSACTKYAANLTAMVSAFNSWDPDFVIETGDLLSSDGCFGGCSENKTQNEALLDAAEALYDNLTMDRHYVLGNHDLLLLTKTEFFSHVGGSQNYYYQDYGDYRIIVLDAQYDEFDEDDAPSDGRISTAELAWLENIALNTTKKCLVFTHQPLNDGNFSSSFVITNASTVRDKLEAAGNVIAAFHGHIHFQDYTEVINGIPYYSVRSNIGDYAENSYGKVSVWGRTIVIDGNDSQAAYNGTSPHGDRTFLFFDDAELASPDKKWTENNPAYGDITYDTVEKYAGAKSLKIVSEDAVDYNVSLSHTSLANLAINFRIKFNETNKEKRFYASPNPLTLSWDNVANIKHYHDPGGWEDSGVDYQTASWEYYEMFFTATSNIILIKRNGETVIPDAHRNNFDSISQEYFNSYYDPILWTDNFYVRKYCSPEPTWGTWGSEEMFDGWLSGYDQRIKLTTDHTKIDDALFDFPVTAFFTDAQAEEIFAEFDADEDFDRGQFVLGNSTLLYAEKELFDDSASLGIYHFRVPSVASLIGTDIYFYYDNDADHNTGYIGIIGSETAEEVWDEYYDLVCHGVDNTTSSVLDSTSNDNDGTKIAANEPVEAVGKVGQGQDIDGDNDYINFGVMAEYGDGDFTVELLFEPDEDGTTERLVWKYDLAGARKGER